MGWESQLRATQANERRQQRDAQKRFRELERQAKEQAKLSVIEQARLEVESFENSLEVLLSIHKEQGGVWNWPELAAALPPHTPRKFARHALKAKQASDIQALGEAHVRDEREYQEAIQSHATETSEWERMRNVARRILAGEPKAYTEVLVQFGGLSEISSLGSSLHFTAHNQKLIECGIKVSGQQAIPSELKTLTATGKVSVKPMPKARFHEIYQDYVCGCVLRVAREVFSLLPVETVLVTASADVLDSRSGQTVEQTVLSVALPRAGLERLNFEHLDPSDAIEDFLHRGDAKASRKSGEFERIVPLTPDDLPQTTSESMDLETLLARVRRMRDELAQELQKLNPRPIISESSSVPPL